MNIGNKVRTVLVFLFFIAAYCIIIATVYTISIVRRNFFLQLAQQQYCSTMQVMPARGLILDRNGKPLALNKDALAAFITPINIREEKKLRIFLTEHFPTALERWQKNPQANFLYIARRLKPEQVELIKKANLPDLNLILEPHRFYPMPAMASIVGITDIDNHGLLGIEFLYDKQLSGQPTTVKLEKDARSGNFHFKKETQTAGCAGKFVQLTIDSDLQFLVGQELKEHAEQLGAKEGAVLVINPATGEILTAATYPTFDPHDTTSLDLEQTKNSIFTDAYERGSVMKTFVALALLQEKLVQPDELIDCKGNKIAYVNGVRISTWKGHGLLTFSELMELSNNIGIATLALRLGPKLYDHYRRLGFGEKTSLMWPGQQSGFVNEPSHWSKSSIISLSFGYEIRATLLQLAQAFMIIARNGIPINITLTLNDKKNSHPLAQEPLYDPKVTNYLKEILERTVRQGTAHRAHIPGYRIWGKTGTANMVIDGHYSLDHNLYTFAGVVEKDSYSRLIITFIKDINRSDVYASTIAVPLFNRVTQTVLIHDKMVTHDNKQN